MMTVAQVLPLTVKFFSMMTEAAQAQSEPQGGAAQAAAGDNTQLPAQTTSSVSLPSQFNLEGLHPQMVKQIARMIDQMLLDRKNQEAAPTSAPTSAIPPISAPTSDVAPTSDGGSSENTSVGSSGSDGGGGGDGGGGSGDPLVFDLNSDGKTDATGSQKGVELDGLTHTKWAAAGDGVLAFKGEVMDTEGGRFRDAYANLTAKAQAAGIDTSKGYLDAADIQKLEARGLSMMMSSGAGVSESKTPTELGISRIDLNAKQVDKRDSAGNRVTAEGSFVRHGQTRRVADHWFQKLG